jgi:hypothetical protein
MRARSLSLFGSSAILAIVTSVFSIQAAGAGAPDNGTGTGTGNGIGGDSLIKLLDGFDLGGARSAISGLVRALGFGAEADGIATFLIGFFVVLVIIGYAAGPKADATASKDDKKQ